MEGKSLTDILYSGQSGVINASREAIIDRMPNAQGFDYYFGPLGANDDGPVEGVPLHENNRPIDTIYDMSVFTRLYTDKAIEYLQKQRDPEKPFVLYLSRTMMHTIIDTSPAFRGTSKVSFSRFFSIF